MADRELASLVDQSKDALQDGERLCLRANFLVQDSARIGVDVLALDAKVRWLSDGVLEQLKVRTDIVHASPQSNVAQSLQHRLPNLSRTKGCGWLRRLVYAPQFHTSQVHHGLTIHKGMGSTSQPTHARA